MVRWLGTQTAFAEALVGFLAPTEWLTVTFNSMALWEPVPFLFLSTGVVKKNLMLTRTLVFNPLILDLLSGANE